MKVVENAIIVPIFTMIIIALISVGIYMHDRIIIRNMVSQISIEYEKEKEERGMRQTGLCSFGI